MPKLIMTVGLAGSGKSTLSKELSHFKVHSSDELRKELFGDVNCMDRNDELFIELHRRIRADLSKGLDVIYDATNLNYKKRMTFLESLNKINCEKICYLFATPYNDCITNDRHRDRCVGEKVITGMYSHIFIPQLYEGFDDIKIIWRFNKDDFDITSYLAKLDGISQGNPYHTLTIGYHMDKCATNLETMTNNDEFYEKLYTAAQIHDIGKLFTKKYDGNKGYYTYYQHHLVGAYDALFYLKVACYSDKDILEICNYIQHHMQPFFLDTEKAKNKFIKLVGQQTYYNIMLLHEADKYAK